MCDKCPGKEKRQLSDIEDEIAKVKAEIDEKYCQLGKSVCEIADQDAGKIGKLVDKLVELKKEHKAQSTGGRIENER